jgi:NAD(P)-dependent dehydrogenase (short-subunit alcohol dehydrogenase family)
MSQPRTILITGCSDGGLGSALALALKPFGWRVLGSGRDLSKLKALQDAGIECIQMDINSTESISKATDEVRKLTGGSLDALVNNAGTGYSMPILDVDLDKIHEVFELNVFSIIRVTRVFLPLLIESSHGGMLINNTSASGLLGVGTPFQGAYAASKAAATSLTESLRLELEPFGIRVINLLTGAVKTTFFVNALGAKLPENSIYSMAKDEIESTMAGNMPGIVKPDAATWAKQVASDLSQPKVPHLVSRGGSAGTARYATLFPTGTFDSLIKKSGGVDVLERKLKEQKTDSKSK